MALVPSQASRVDQSLQEAINEFQSVLTEDQRKEFRKVKNVPDADTVITFTAQLDIANTQRKGNSIASRFYSFLQSIHQFSSIVDTFVSSNPNIAALVWGSVKFTLLVKFTVNFVSYFEELSNLFMSFNKYCPRLAEYQILYHHKPRLQRALCAFHASIIRCCKKALEVAQRSWQTQVLNALWRSSIEEFAPYKAVIEKCSVEVTEEIALAKAQDDYQDQKLQTMERKAASISRHQSKKFFSKARVDLDDVKQWQIQRDERLAEERRERLLDSLSDHDHITPFNQNRKKRHNGTAQWLSGTAEFIEWMNQPRSSVFWCSGKLGSGKTVLTSSVIDYLFLEERSLNVPITFFFPRYDDPETLKAETIFRSITRQCLDSSKLSAAVESDLTKIERNRLSGLDAVTELLRQRVKMSQTFYIVIDALDECEKCERSILLDRLSSLSTTKVNVKIFFASRDSMADEIRRHFSSIYHNSMDCAQAQSDIATYIKEIIDTKLYNEDLIVGDMNIVKEIQDALTQGAHGMFLWVSFQIDDLCSQKCDEDIREVLKNLPKDLTETFNRSLHRIILRGNAKVARQIFPWLAAAKRPLLLDELREAIAIEPGQTYFKAHRLVNGISRLTAWCENLIQIDEESNIVQFAHHTVLTYLLSDASDHLLTDFHFRLSDVDHYVGEICVTYLDLDDFKTTLARQHKSLPFPEPSDIAEAALGQEPNARIHTSILNLVNRKYSKKTIDTDIVEILARHTGNHTDRSVRDMHKGRSFLDYACRFWLLHTTEFQKGKTKSWKKWIAMISGTHELASTPWTANDFNYADSCIWEWSKAKRHRAMLQIYSNNVHIKPDFFSGELALLVQAGDIEFLGILFDVYEFSPPMLGSALLIAAEFGHTEIVKMFLVAKADANAKISNNHGGWTALQEAAERGYSEIVEMLLAAKADVNAAGFETALHSASRVGNSYIVHTLLGAGANVNAKSMNRGQTALQLAAENGHLEIIKMLLEMNANVNAGIDGVKTALQVAATKGHLEMVRMLLDAKANINAGIAHGGETALQAAAYAGYLDIVRLLLAANAEPDAGINNGGKTALQLASVLGHLDVIKCLLQAGADVNAGIIRNIPTALQVAVERGHLDVVKCLLEAKAEVNAGIYGGQTALQIAAKNGELEIVKILLAANAEVNAGMVNGGKTALAAAEGYTAMIEMLQLAKDDVTSGIIAGRSTALQEAANGGYFEIVWILLEANADVNATADGPSALTAAAARGHLDIVDLLLAAKADVNAVSGGQDAITAAATAGHFLIVNMLLAAKGDINAVPGGQNPLMAANRHKYSSIVSRFLTANASH